MSTVLHPWDGFDQTHRAHIRMLDEEGGKLKVGHFIGTGRREHNQRTKKYVQLGSGKRLDIWKATSLEVCVCMCGHFYHFRYRKQLPLVVKQIESIKRSTYIR